MMQTFSMHTWACLICDCGWLGQWYKWSVAKDFVIFNMYEIWKYEMTTFEKGGLFTDFINNVLNQAIN